MSLDIACPLCEESENLEGRRSGERITITCGECGQVWERPTNPVCASCAGTDLQAVPHAIVEKSRGTQLSVVAIRIVHLCWACDADAIERWQRNRPNPLLPSELPTFTKEE